jgi:hypothetical protein
MTDIVLLRDFPKTLAGSAVCLDRVDFGGIVSHALRFYWPIQANCCWFTHLRQLPN